MKYKYPIVDNVVVIFIVIIGLIKNMKAGLNQLSFGTKGKAVDKDP